MSWNKVLSLYKLSDPEVERDENGFKNPKSEAQAKVVYANKKSVGYSEFYKAQVAGIAAIMKFDIHAAEYNGEQIAEYEGVRYRIYRTYNLDTELLELTLTDTPAPQEQEAGNG